jgi:hypothetical protein
VRADFLPLGCFFHRFSSLDSFLHRRSGARIGNCRGLGSVSVGLGSGNRSGIGRFTIGLGSGHYPRFRITGITLGSGSRGSSASPRPTSATGACCHPGMSPARATRITRILRFAKADFCHRGLLSPRHEPRPRHPSHPIVDPIRTRSTIWRVRADSLPVGSLCHRSSSSEVFLYRRSGIKGSAGRDRHYPRFGIGRRFRAAFVAHITLGSGSRLHYPRFGITGITPVRDHQILPSVRDHRGRDP